MSVDEASTNYDNDAIPTQKARVQTRAGIVNVPRGSRGPRSLYIARRDDNFGFTLRHFIVYPPDSSEFSGRNAPTGVQLQPMETIFVKQVVEGGPAEQAGLKKGDRLVAVNGLPVTDKPYSEVIQYIQRSPEYLHLLVISKEEDILQKYYTEFAYNPATNQQPRQPQQAEQTSTFPRKGSEIQADAISWRSLQNQNYQSLEYGKLKPKHPKEQHSADNILNSKEYLRNQRSFDAVQTPPHRQAPGVVHLHEAYHRPRAQPQVPSNKKMGRRASEGSTFADKDIYSNCVVNQSNEMVVGDNPKMQKNQYASEPMPHPQHHPSLALAGCRLSLDAGRRDSASSLTSSLADGSKDSLSSFDSSSTVTGQELDNPVMSRIIKSFQQKEQFLNANNNNNNVHEQQSIQREFYGRPRKLEKQVWPPPEVRQDSPSRAASKPTHQNFQRVKNDIDNERDYALASGGAGGNMPPQQKIAASPKDWHHMSAYKVPEAAEAPSDLENTQQINGAAVNLEVEDKRSAPPPSLQIVSTRAKQFESGRSLPDDDPIMRDRMSYHRSELARLSAKKVVPNVTVRAREFETRNMEPKRDTSTSSTNSGVILRKTHRDSRSLDSSDSTNVGSTGSINSISEHHCFPRLSGNITVPIGSKYLHVPPPKEYQESSEDISNVVDNLPTRIRIRSNSADSWMGSKHEDNESFGNSIDVITKEDRSLQEAMDVSPTPTNRNAGNLSPLIPESVEQMNLATPPPVSVTPPVLMQKSPVRPTQLDLAGAPKRPARHLRPPSETLDTLQPPRSLSPALEDRPVVVRRNKNNTNIADEERAMRRESYLKATEVGRMHLDSDFSDLDASSQVLRSAHRRWRPPLFPGDIQQLRKLFEDAASSLGSSGSGASSSSVSLEKEKRPGSPSDREKQSIVKEGHLHCKITEIDGKRATDRSWKQIWVVLKGPRLYLYKDKHHQSPVGTASDVVEQSLSSGIDMRTSCVRIAEDYTKRKHVLRVSSILPCRTELLLQAENPIVLADWVKALQEQVAANTEVEAKMDQLGVSKQQAVPQTSPASTSIQVQGSSRLSPQPPKSKLPNLRNRSPTGTSPVSKTRKPTQIPEAATSPKSKTWGGRLANKFRKRQGASSPTSPTAPEGATFGIPLDLCQPSNGNQYVPRIVEVCTKIVEDNGLETIGIYRVPGNNAAVTALTEEANRCYDELLLIDQRWKDVHVVSSLLKSFFRKMPDSLLTAALYPRFIEADKIENSVSRLEHIKKLIKSLPIHHYHTLKHLILHLKTVVEYREYNKMEAKNLAIVFGPTIVRAAEENMETMVNDMTHQCKIVESLLSYADWFFNDKNVEQLKLAVPAASSEHQEPEQINTTLLLDNISKVEAFKEQKDKKELFTSLIMAAQRKVKKKTTKSAPGSQDSKDEAITPNGIKEFPGQSYDETDLKENVVEKATQIPTTVTELDQSNKLWFNYKTDKEAVEQRIKNFIQETEANLNTTRKPQINTNLERRGTGAMCSSATNVNQSTQLSLAGHGANDRVITKTHSASNVFSRTTSSENRNSYNSADGYRTSSQHPTNFSYGTNYSGSYRNSSDNYNDRRIRQLDNSSDFQVYKTSFSDVSTASSSEYHRPTAKTVGYNLRKGNSAENINSSSVDLNSNTNMKKIKFENETDISQRTSSLDSLHKIDDSNDENDLVKTMTKLYDEKSKELSSPLLLEIDLPFADESPEKLVRDHSHLNKENIPGSPKLYRNPSLHKNQYLLPKVSVFQNKESKAKTDKEKDEDSTMTADELTPDNEKNLSNQDISMTSKKININVTLSPANIKLKRSESLNKPERTSSPLTIKLKRSESLNKTGDKVKRSDSLTKTEKTESNISKRRETNSARRTNKEFAKLKRKNGMPERSIKRRHTVGGTKDPDKVTWWDNRNQVEDSNVTESAKEKTLRTSSPDLSTSRRERLFLQVNLITSEDMVATLRQHLIGSRPQSFPEATVYKLPLESHV